jgi:tellurite resistance protein TehA-like permease
MKDTSYIQSLFNEITQERQVLFSQKNILIRIGLIFWGIGGILNFLSCAIYLSNFNRNYTIPENAHKLSIIATIVLISVVFFIIGSIIILIIEPIVQRRKNITTIA